MRSALIALIALVCAAALVPSAAGAYVSPGSPAGYVSDFANVLSDPARAQLETELSLWHASTTNEVAVVTIPSLEGDTIENYAVELFEEWGIGDKEKDNGILLLIAIVDRELRIEVGYGLEGALPDSVVQSIINDVIVPELKNEDYDAAATEGARAIMRATEGEYEGGGSRIPNLDMVFTIFVVGIIAIQWLAAILARSKSFWAGGVVGGTLGAGVSTFFGYWLLGGIAITGILVVLGTLFDYAVSTSYREAKTRGIFPPWWAGGSGGHSGSSGGGFGGFGGGSSGGGGASGRW